MNIEQTRQRVIENYIAAYNRFDIEGMLENLHSEIEFQNISNGETNLSIKGIDQFSVQAESAEKLFSQREQKITNILFEGDKAEVEIDYSAVLAEDLPNGLKKDAKIELKGKSIFTFRDGKIIGIQDIS